MVRRKKSLLFSVSLASAGLVAGALLAASPKSQAAEDIYGAAANDATIHSISKDTGLSLSEVKDIIGTKKLIVGVNSEDELKNNPDVVSYKKVAEGVYIVYFSDYDSTFRNYIYYNEDGRDSSAGLNYPLKMQDTAGTIPVEINEGGTTGIPEADKCLYADLSTLTRTNFTRMYDQCLSWGTESMKLNDFAHSINSANTIRVAVVDSGIRANHDAFSYASDYAKDRLDMSLAYDYYGSSVNPETGDRIGDPDPDDSDNAYDGDSPVSHGTSVAGLIAGSTPYNVKIVPVRVTDGMSLDIALALDVVSDLKGKVDVINLSFGTITRFSPGDNDYELRDLVMKEAKEAGTIVVASTGNSGEGYVSWPASSEYTIAVGATNDTNRVASFSQYGNQVDFVAPGDTLLVPRNASNYAVGVASGTSFSAPLVAAAVANLLSENPNYSFDQIYKILKLNSEDIEATGKDSKAGWGSVSFRINKFADLNLSATNTTSAWTNQDATISASATSSAYNVSKYAVVNGAATDTAPSSWKTVSSPARTVNVSEAVSESGTYTVWFKNANNEISAKTVAVNTIDKAAPTISSSFAVTNITENGAKLTIGASDAASGLSKVVWHYKTASDSTYTDKIDEYGADETSAAVKSFTLSGLMAGETYMTYATIFDTAGNSKDSDVATFKAGLNETPVQTVTETSQTDPEPESEPEIVAEKPSAGAVQTVSEKRVSTQAASTTNPNTADINLPVIAGMGGALMAASFFIFRAKRR